MAKTFEELLVVANKIRTNELPESNTHALVGSHLVSIIDKIVDLHIKGSSCYNVTINHTIPNGFHTLESAISAVPNNIRKNGLIITYAISSYKWEIRQFISSDISQWNAIHNWKSIGKENLLLLDYNNDDSNTRKSVCLADRKQGIIIGYYNGKEYILEQYISTLITDSVFVDNNNWIRILTQKDLEIINSKLLGLNNKIDEVINNLTSKIVDAKDVLPFDGFDYELNYPNKSNAVGIGEGDVFYDDAEFRFFKIIENVLYHAWEGEYPNISYSLDGSAFRMDKVYVNIDDKKSYTGSMDGTPILISNVLTVYQTMGTSTSGTISQKILTQKFDSIDKGIFNDLGVLGEDFDSLDNISTTGTYQYIVKGPVIPGKPQALYNYRLFVVDNVQLQISRRGILNREYSEGRWSEWKESGSAEDIEVLQSLVSIADDKATAALEELNRRFPFKIQTFSGGKIAEKGTTVSTILNWSYDGIPVSQGLTRNGIPILIDLSDRSVSINDITENLSCVLTANGLTATQNISFYNCRFVGAISDAPTTESQVKALTKLPVASGRGYTWTGNLNDQRICFCYPKSFGALSSIRDANNFEYVSGFSRSEVIVNNELYYVYVSGKQIVENFKYIFS